MRMVLREWWPGLKPFPKRKAILPFTVSLTQRQFKYLKYGFYPSDMNDKWFVFFEDEWMYFYRSWSKVGIYKVRFKKVGEKYEAVETWCNNSPGQYLTQAEGFEGLGSDLKTRVSWVRGRVSIFTDSQF